VLLKL
jgi:putative transposase